MTRLATNGFEAGVLATDGWSGGGTKGAYETTVVNTGTKSYKFASASVPGTDLITRPVAMVLGQKLWFRVYWRILSTSVVGTHMIMEIATNAGGFWSEVDFNAISGKLSWQRTGLGNQDLGITVTAGQWYCIDYGVQHNSGGTATFEVWVDDVQKGSYSAASGFGTAIQKVILGNDASANTQTDAFWDDFAVNDDQGAAPDNTRIGPINTVTPANTGYGDGSYGVGTYGIRLDSSTPIAGTESFSLSEGATVLAIDSSRADSWALTDANGGIALSGPSDASTLTDTSSLVQQILLSVTDSWALSEGTTALANALAAADALTHSESTAAIAAALDASEGHTLTEGTTAVAAALAAADSWTLTDASALSTLLALSVNDSFGFTDVSSLLVTTAIAGTDTQTQSEGTTAVDAALAASDTGTLTDVSASTLLLAPTDALIFSDSSALATALAATDSWALTESPASVQSVTLLTLTDTLTQSEGTTSVAAAVAAAEAIGFVDLSSLTTAVSAFDAITQSEAASALATALTASDSLTLTDASALAQSVSIIVSDIFTLAEAASVLTAAPEPPIHRPTSAAIFAWAAEAVISGYISHAEVAEYAAAAAIVGKLGGATFAPKSTRAEIQPYSTGAEFDT